MSIATTIENRVREEMPVAHLELVNESDQHNVPENSETHFRLVAVSEAFAGMPRVRRHQRIYALLGDLMPQPVHALRIHAWTPEEWNARGGRVEASPACRGGSKHDPELGQ